ncbi:2-iminobutanoate/2-iminopropanoate deaminase isoform X2 [Nothobranchius furzeri]
MNLQIQKYCIFRRHSQMYLEPAIYHKWKEDQKHHLEDLKKKGKITVSGDMRADSPGCSIKYGTYTLMDVQSEKVVDMNLVQSNEVGGRSHLMEKEGLCRSLDLLEENGVEVDYIVTDQHPEIQKYLRERDVAHHYDVWHVVKGLSKKLENISKEKECQVVKKWLPAIQNHMYWTASSSTSGPEKVAKWTSLINHIQDVHVHDDPLFPKCVHPEQVSRNPNKWFQPGTPALNKVKKLLVNNRLLEDVAKLSSCYQTSSLESFHSSIVRFTPKKSDFRYVGMLCRQFLAAIHHNENAKWKQALSKDALFKVSYPKYKRAQGATKVKTKTTFGYVAALMHLIFCEIVVDPYKFVAQLKAVAVPDGLCTQFKRASKKDIAADVSRFSPQPGGGGGQNHVRLWSDRDGRSLWSAGGWRCAGAGPTGSRQYGGDSQSCWL